MYESEQVEGSDVTIIAYGITARVAAYAVKQARQQGLKVGQVRLITLWPFNDRLMREIADKTKAIIVAEMNLGQIAREVERFVSLPVVRVSKIGGVAHSVEDIYQAIVQERA